MEQTPTARSTASNLTPTWDVSDDPGGSWRPDASRAAVSAALRPPSMVDHLVNEPADLPAAPDYDSMRVRDIARELLRARLVAIAEQRQHRSAYEIAFILLTAAVCVLLAAPPLVQVLLALHGTAA